MKTLKSDLQNIAMLISHPDIPNDPEVFIFLKLEFFFLPILTERL